MSNEQPNYYHILGVSPQASLETIRAAYKKACQDTAHTRGKTAQQLLKAAYEVLSNPERRATYDNLLQDSQQPALQLNLELSRDTLTVSDSEQLLYLLVQITAAEQHRTQKQRPLNLCFVVDHSSSMKGERLKQVKEAVSLIFAKLTPDDVVSLVSFNDRADVAIPATSNTNIKLLQSRINAIKAAGGTEIYQGLLAANQQLNTVSLPRYNNQLILLTDGQTYGDEEQCLALAQKMAAKGIGISAFGLGAEWNDQFLDSLVSASGGQSNFIETPEQVLAHLQDRIQGLGTVHARQVRLLTDFGKVAIISYGLKVAPFTQPLDTRLNELKLGNLEGRSPLSVLLELRIAPHAHEARLRLPIKVTAEIGETAVNTVEKTYPATAHCLVLTNTTAPETPSPYLTKAVRIMTLYRMNEKAWADAQSGHLDQATRRMQHLTTRLLEAGQTQLAHQAQTEANRLAHMGTISLEGRKAIKYGTRALINEALSMDEE